MTRRQGTCWQVIFDKNATYVLDTIPALSSIERVSQFSKQMFRLQFLESLHFFYVFIDSRALGHDSDNSNKFLRKTSTTREYEWPTRVREQIDFDLS